jgi:hypothetical protein
METVKLTVDGVEEIFEGETLLEAKNKKHSRLKELHAEHAARREEWKKRHANDKEINAKGKRGFLLWSYLTDRHFFRIYNWQDEELCNKEESVNMHGFKDYEIYAEDVEVEILAGGLSLYENEDGEHRLDWSRRATGRPEK